MLQVHLCFLDVIFSSAICFVLQKYKARKQNIFFGTKFVNIFIVCINNGSFVSSTSSRRFWPQSLSNKRTNLKHFEPEGEGPNTEHIQATYDPSSSSPS